MGGLRSIMARWLTVLVALLAQGMALASPVCFVRCVAPNGHERVELMGQDCRCCDCTSSNALPQVCAVVTCGHDHEDEDQSEHDARLGWQVQCERCSCQHSLLGSIPQVQSKSLVSDFLSTALKFVAVSATLDFDAEIQALENANPFAHGGWKPQESPQLAMLATVVFRV